MAGRRPKPTALKIVAGNPGKRALNKSEPSGQEFKNTAFSVLTSEAKRLWDNLSPILLKMGVLSDADKLTFERLCECYSEIQELQEQIRISGRTFETKSTDGDKTIKANPAVAMLADADRRFKSYLVEFGLTPAARSKVQMNEHGKKDNPADKFFGT